METGMLLLLLVTSASSNSVAYKRYFLFLVVKTLKAVQAFFICEH